VSESRGEQSIEKLWERTSGRLAKMTAAQRKQTLVDAGILTKKGNVTAPYKQVLGFKKK